MIARLGRMWCRLTHRMDHWATHVSTGCYRCGRHKMRPRQSEPYPRHAADSRPVPGSHE
jgi:hypothetical protein